MRIDIMTLFPETVGDMMNESILGRAQERDFIKIECHQIRDYTTNKQNQVDDYPYGGGPGMVMQAQPIYDCCVDVIRQMEEAGHARPHVVFMTAAGTPLTEEKCKQLAQKDSLLLVCGHYEGIDERVIEALADEEGLSVMGVELAEKNGLLELRVLLRYENETGEAVVTIGGE